MVLAAIVAALALTACGDESGIESGGDAEAAGVVPAGEATDELTISQWPLYIDPGKQGTVAEFENETASSS